MATRSRKTPAAPPPPRFTIRAWDDIIGQAAAQDVLQRAVEHDRVHHGYLFVGPNGVGKFATALAFARALECARRPQGHFADACGTCPSCRKFANDIQHPDVAVVLPEGLVNKFIKIDQIRAVQKLATTKPYESRYQIVLLDDVHLMTDEAANALLKTLEEPPATMRLMLVTDQPHALLDTILSRCQTVRFGSLESDDVVRILKDTLDEAHPEEELRVAAAFGEGSVGRARELLEAGILIERSELLDRVAQLRRDATASLLTEAEAFAKDTGTLNARLDLLKVILRDVMLTRLRQEGQNVSADRLVNSDMQSRIAALAQRHDVDGLISRIDSVRVAQNLLSRNVSAKLVIENLFTELAAGPVRNPVAIPRHLR